jgi:hypothetical protein
LNPPEVLAVSQTGLVDNCAGKALEKYMHFKLQAIEQKTVKNKSCCAPAPASAHDIPNPCGFLKGRIS